MTKHRLIDAEKTATEHPKTFRIPRREYRYNCVKGDMVKLGFLMPEAMDNGCDGERMWVEVEETEGPDGARTGYRGALRNAPVYMDGLSSGDEVVFEPRHILDFELAPGCSHAETEKKEQPQSVRAAIDLLQSHASSDEVLDEVAKYILANCKTPESLKDFLTTFAGGAVTQFVRNLSVRINGAVKSGADAEEVRKMVRETVERLEAELKKSMEGM